MYIILVYDVNVDRVTTVMKKCREYLDHAQNSVFVGELTLSHFKELKMKLKKIINTEEDSLTVFKLRSKKYMKREDWGKKNKNMSNFI